jgi:hypothetical protein
LFSVLYWLTRLCLVAFLRLPFAVAHEQGVLPAVVVTPVAVIMVSMSIYLTIERVRSRRRERRNWFTGLAPRAVRSSPSGDAAEM